MKDEAILLGDESLSLVVLTGADAMELKRAATLTDSPDLRAALNKVLAAPVGPLTVTCVDIRGRSVRLGVDAPMAVSIHRREVYDEIKAMDRQAEKAAAEARAKAMANGKAA